jgi:exonuclease SbcC
MKIESIGLKGFIGIKRGLGLDEIDVDLMGLSGLVALEGANGVGKTTFLENLQPYRMLPSRGGTLKNHCFLKDSLKDLTFTFNGDRYRTLIKSDATTTRSDEGYIWKNNDPQVNGKVSQYDEYIVKLLGTPNLYFSSIFCAQNSKKLSDMRPAELKNLFAEFLRLDRYVRWEQTSKDAVRICAGAAQNMVSLEAKIQEKIDMQGKPADEIKEVKKLIDWVSEKCVESKHTMEHTQSVIDLVKKQVTESEVNRQRIKDHTKIIEDLKAEQVEAVNCHRQEENGRAAALLDLQTDLTNQKETVEQKWSIDAAVIATKAGVIDIEKLHRTIHDINNHNQKLTIKIDLLQLDINDGVLRIAKITSDQKINDLEKDLEQARAKYREAEKGINNINDHPAIVKITGKMAALMKSAKVLDDIDPDCTSEVCGLITASLDAKKELPGVIKKSEALKRSTLELFRGEEKQQFEIGVGIKKHIELLEEKRIAALVGEKEKQTRAQTTIKDIKSDFYIQSLETAKDNIQTIQAQIEKLKPLVEKHPQLIEAEAKVTALEKEITRITSLGVEKAEAYQKQTQETADKTSKAQAVIDSIIINFEAEKQLTDAEEALEDATRDWESQERTRLGYVERLKQFEFKVQALVALEAEKKQVWEKLIWVKSEQSKWDYLANACSKDGMRALEIEAVAPVITQHSNDMLTGTFGPTHTVRFETQDEEGREVLQIIVISADGSETPLEYLSGGERVWILKALRLSQTLISQEKSGRHFQTSLMDEEDGALSLKNALKFIQLYRTFIATAKMDLCFYISHRPEAVSMADAILEFRKGGVSII